MNNSFLFCFRSNISRCFRSRSNSKSARRPRHQLLATDSVISTLRFSAAEPARAPGKPGSACDNYDAPYCRHSTTRSIVIVGVTVLPVAKTWLPSPRRQVTLLSASCFIYRAAGYNWKTRISRERKECFREKLIALNLNKIEFHVGNFFEKAVEQCKQLTNHVTARIFRWHLKLRSVVFGWKKYEKYL